MSLVGSANDGSAEKSVTKEETLPAQPGPPPRIDPLIEKRREQRYPACDMVEVEVIGAPNSRFGGMIVDISKSGLRLEVGKPLARGAHLEIVLPSRAIVIGEARYCRTKGKLYYVGVSIQGVYFAQSASSRHIDKDLIARYARGQDLDTIDSMEIRSHLVVCEACRDDLAKSRQALAPRPGIPPESGAGGAPRSS
jgi:hypothetical protein